MVSRIAKVSIKKVVKQGSAVLCSVGHHHYPGYLYVRTDPLDSEHA